MSAMASASSIDSFGPFARESSTAYTITPLSVPFASSCMSSLLLLPLPLLGLPLCGFQRKYGTRAATCWGVKRMITSFHRLAKPSVSSCLVRLPCVPHHFTDAAKIATCGGPLLS
ncbi:unnamed protein product [Prorocentrum cordatum]|uniref:Uncharacterized protein n=1 Tax=Prorocentrum cordatum TaxID=2364126 RepID=A0ABN9X6F3_9DINO|nr:unnamed protein product [Polarella glacialis]